jgi:putative restriction endonuclease
MAPVRGVVATTDFSWFTFLRGQPQPLEEVNFWQPSAHAFKPPPGTPFFFKLKSPHYAIGGFGIFARYEEATPELAWEAFGTANGAASFEEMRRRVEEYAKASGKPGHRIGCIMVSRPVFFADGDWVEQPADWQKNIVSSKGYDLSVGEGRRMWDACQERAFRYSLALPFVADGPANALQGVSEGPRFGPPQLVRPRLGQGTFRVAVTAAYRGACAVSGEHSLPVLEAAHIQPFATAGGTHEVSNGLLLRADIHRLFDRGYVTVTPDLRFVVSERLAKEFENGRAYYKRQGKQLAVPPRLEDQPNAELLRWHNDHVFERGAA